MSEGGWRAQAGEPGSRGPGPRQLGGRPLEGRWIASSLAATEPDAAVRATVGQARTALEVLAGKWVVPIVAVLLSGPRRHGDLHEAVGPGVSQKVLTETLRRMERAGLVSREVRAEVPPVVLYSLTDLGRTLVEPIKHLAQWASTHSQRLTR